MNRFILLMCLLSLPAWSQSQTYFRAQALLVSYFPVGNPNLQFADRSITGDKSLVLQPGIDFTYNVNATSVLGLAANKVFFLNTGNHLSGALRLQLTAQVLKNYKHTLTLGVGPALHYRTDEPLQTVYSDTDVYTSSNTGFGYKVVWISGEVVYNYTLSKKTDISISLNHTEPQAATLSAGIRYWISKKAKGKACNCPTFKR